VHDHSAWLKSVAKWVAAHWRITDQMICSFLPKSGEREDLLPFAGVGVYTLPELLFLAGIHFMLCIVIYIYKFDPSTSGIPPFLMVKEVLACPPRMFRLCEALYGFVDRPPIE
jgi:hypothetical protein